MNHDRFTLKILKLIIASDEPLISAEIRKRTGASEMQVGGACLPWSSDQVKGVPGSRGGMGL